MFLNNEGYIHNTVNHQKWLIDPDTNKCQYPNHKIFVENTKKRIYNYKIIVNCISLLLPRQVKEEWRRSLHPNNHANMIYNYIFI